MVYANNLQAPPRELLQNEHCKAPEANIYNVLACQNA